MLNPDGVDLGFTRTNNLGYNLNSKWDDSLLKIPEIMAINKLIE